MPKSNKPDIIWLSDNDLATTGRASYVHLNPDGIGVRATSGDLVGYIEGSQFLVDQSDEWLFDWEKEDPTCYARRMQRMVVIPLRIAHTTRVGSDGAWRALWAQS